MSTESLGLLAALYFITGLAIAFGHYYFQPSKAAPQRKPLGKIAAYSWGTLAYGVPFGIYLLYLAEYANAGIFAGFVFVAGIITIYTDWRDRQALQEKSQRDSERRQEITSTLNRDHAEYYAQYPGYDMDGD